MINKYCSIDHKLLNVCIGRKVGIVLIFIFGHKKWYFSWN